MIRICVLAAPADLAWLRDTVAELSIRRGWPDCEISSTSRPTEWERRLEPYGSVDLILLDVGLDPGAELLKLARRANPAALVVPLVTASIPPTVYVRPEILPFSLLWHPLKGPENREMLAKVLEHLFAGSAPEEQVLTVKGKRESYKIPYREICYFEARDKRVFAHLPEQELAMSETLAALEERVPPRFLRCHKGFLVNGDMVESVDWSKQLLLLRGKLAVPISRSYRAKVKERINGID
jgi:two-component system LytT family response regulator